MKRVAGLALASCLLLPCASAAKDRTTTKVNCDKGATIGGALANIDKAGPNTLEVYGTCRENVVIDGFDDLKIVGKPGATIIPVAPTTAHAIDVNASRAVSIEGLTIRQAEDRQAMLLAACADCRLISVTVEGGVGPALAAGRYYFSRFSMTGSGGYAGINAWNSADLTVEDSSFDGGSPGSSGWGRFAGIWVGWNATAAVRRSEFRHLGTAVYAEGGGLVQIEGSTIEDNGCFGVYVGNQAQLRISTTQLRNNGVNCWGGGVDADFGSTLSIGQSEVRGNTGGGIRLNHHALARLGPGTIVSGNLGAGLVVRNDSMAVAPNPANPPETVEISGNQGDLRCDALSQINNSAQISGATQVQCANLFSGDGPSIP